MTPSALDELATETIELSGRRAGERWGSALGLAYKLGLDPLPRERDGTAFTATTIEYDARLNAPERERELNAALARAIARWALHQWDMIAPPAQVDALAARLVELHADEGAPPLPSALALP